MIFVAGAGAMADAAAAMRRQQRQINRRIRLSRLRAKTRRMVIDGDYEPESTDFDCVYLCPTCSYFVRSAQTDDGPGEPCVACGETEWFDLSKEGLAGRIRHQELEERSKAPWYIRQFVAFATVGIFAATFIGLLVTSYFSPQDYTLYACLVGTLSFIAVPTAYYTLPRRLSVLWLRGRQRLPHRWHVPYPLPGPDEPPTDERKQLVAEAVDETIESPISGRECIAYEICVLFDAPDDARPPEWALQEQNAVDARLGDELQLRFDRLYLESPVEQVEPPETLRSPAGEEDDSDDADSKYEPGVEQFLRQRGLYLDDGEFLFYEACLQPGDEVDVADYDGQMYVIRHCDAVDGDELPALPRVRDRS